MIEDDRIGDNSLMDSKLDNILRKCVKDLEKKFRESLVSVILFGSHARNLSKQYSDIDLLVLLQKLDLTRMEKSELEFELSWNWQGKYNKKIDLLIMSCEDALDNFAIPSPLFLTITLGLKIYYDRNRFFFNNFTSFLEELKSQKYFYSEPEATWDLSQKATDLLNLQKNLSA